MYCEVSTCSLSVSLYLSVSVFLRLSLSLSPRIEMSASAIKIEMSKNKFSSRTRRLRPHEEKSDAPASGCHVQITKPTDVLLYLSQNAHALHWLVHVQTYGGHSPKNTSALRLSLRQFLSYLSYCSLGWCSLVRFAFLVTVPSWTLRAPQATKCACIGACRQGQRLPTESVTQYQADPCKNVHSCTLHPLEQGSAHFLLQLWKTQCLATCEVKGSVLVFCLWQRFFPSA